MSTVDSKFGLRGLESRQKLGEMFDFCLPPTPNSARAASKVDKNWEKCLIFVYRLFQIRPCGTESRQKPEEMCNFCLPAGSNSGCAASKVEQNLEKLRKCSTAAYKFGPRGPESRTKSPKFGKMFYSVTFAKAVRSQITDKSQKAPFYP